MQSPLRHVGGKARLARQIVPLLTTGGDIEYREPFVGGGGMMVNVLAKGKYARVLLNDKDVGIAAFWTAFLQDAERLMRRVRRLRRSTITPALFDRLKSELSHVGAMPQDRKGVLDLGFKKLLLHRISYSGLGTKAGGPMGGRAGRSAYTIDSRWNPEAICRRILHARRVLEGVKVRENRCTNLDFEHVIRDESCPAMLYLDPPYFVQGNGLYQCGFTPRDHARLAEALRSTPHPWLLSYDDCPQVRSAYDWAKIKKVTTTYSVARTRPKVTELLISPRRSDKPRPDRLTRAGRTGSHVRWVVGQFRYAGGKSKMCRRIVPILACLTHEGGFEYREPFVGGGSVLTNFLAANPSVNKVWLNDLNVGVAAYWDAVILAPDRLKRWVRRFVPTIEAFARHRAELRGATDMPTSLREIVRLGAIHLIVHQLSFSGLGTRGGPLGGWEQRHGDLIGSHWRPDAICARIDLAHGLLSRVTLRHGRCTRLDFERVVRDQTRPARLYLDPPYVGPGNALYPCGFATADHVRLRDALRSIPHRWLLSYDDCPQVREGYSWAHIDEVRMTSFVAPRQRSRRTELLITAQPVAVTPSQPRRRKW